MEIRMVELGDFLMMLTSILSCVYPSSRDDTYERGEVGVSVPAYSCVYIPYHAPISLSRVVGYIGEGIMPRGCRNGFITRLPEG
jgi:hypothetical protein